MKHIFIINPMAGKTNQVKLEKEIRRIFMDRTYVIEVTTKPKEATDIARRHAQTGKEMCIYACGGDGTINEVANGMYLYKNAKLGVIPIGTGNDFIKSFLSLQRDDFLNLHNYMEPKEFPFDVLSVNDYISVNTASAGLDVKISMNVDKFKKIPFTKGILPYYLSLLYSMLSSISHNFKVKIDEVELDDDTYTFIVGANGKYYGGGFCPSPNAILDDAYMDVVLIKKVTRRKMIALSNAYKKGTHLEYTDLVSVYRCKKLELITDEKCYLNMDGELIEEVNPCIKVLEKQIVLYLPKVD